MDDEKLGERLGILATQIEAVDTRLQEHVRKEEAWQNDVIAKLTSLTDTLSQATGARKVVVWIIATLFAGVALAKGWLWKP